MKAFSGATAKQLAHYTIPTLEEECPEVVIIHVGVNNLLHKGKVETQKLAGEIVGIGLRCKELNVKDVIISSIVYSTKADVNTIRKVNEEVSLLCKRYGFMYIENNNINRGHLWKDGIHLNEYGTTILANNLIYSLRGFLSIVRRTQTVT